MSFSPNSIFIIIQSEHKWIHKEFAVLKELYGFSVKREMCNMGKIIQNITQVIKL